MRIVHTCLRYPPASGGVETYVKEIVERTRHIPSADEPAAGGNQIRDVRVLTSNMRTHGPITELDPDLLLDDPMYVQRLHHLATPFISYPRLQSLAYYLGHHQPDIIHGHSFWYQPADAAARFAQKHSIPFILQPYYYETAIRQKPFWQLYKRTVGKRTFAAAAAVITISPYEQSLLEQSGLPAQRFELIPPGIDHEFLVHRRINPFLKRNISGKVLLTVGRVAEAKGLDEIILALPLIKKQIPDIQLVIAGEDFGALNALQTLVSRAGVADRVHFVGRLADSELAGAYQHAWLFVHPAQYEAFGIVVAEALASGTPVVARNTAAIPFVAPHGTAALLYTQTSELIENILTIFRQPKLREALARGGQAHVQNNFTWEKSIKKLITLYQELVR